MKLLEYEAKALLKKVRIAVPKSFMAGDQPAFLPVALKSQIPVGGRGKAGGIVMVNSPDEYQSAVATLLNLDIKGHTPKTLLAEEVLAIKNEYYLSLTINKSLAQIELMANRNGGVEVEENPEDSYWKMTIGKWQEKRGEEFDIIGQQLADYLDLPGKTFVLQDLVEKLYHCFVENDALLLEINPLILTKGGDVIAGDCKMELDSAAVWRHSDWDFETKDSESNFVTLDADGTVATIANGAGLAMATVDAVADSGLQPANFLDIGGGASEGSVLAAFKRIAEYPSVKVIIVNIFAGITRCDEVARAIVSANQQLPDLPKVEVRLAGTNYDVAAEILGKNDIALHPNLSEAIKAAKHEVMQ
jgi:succinyl-CoA synthetase beta subunit